MIESLGVFVFSAERTVPISNLKSLNELETNRLERAVSPHRIHRSNNETPTELLYGDLRAINDLLFYVEAEPFITPEKTENFKRVAFKKLAGM